MAEGASLLRPTEQPAQSAGRLASVEFLTVPGDFALPLTHGFVFFSAPAVNFAAPAILGRRIVMSAVFREHQAVGLRSLHAEADGDLRSFIVVLGWIVMLLTTWVLLRAALG
jgi:hypothetical protein